MKMANFAPMKAKLAIIPSLFFGAYLLLGLLVYGDYGMSWDEQLQRQHGLVSAQYVNTVFPYTDKQYNWRALESYEHRHYGVVFSLPMAWLEDALNLDTFRQRYRLRHCCTFLLYWLASVVFYRILRRRFGPSWALAGAVFWVLSPRLFAHSFFNPKDIPFLSLYVISTWTLFRFWLRPGLGTASLHALSCGLLIGMRVTGLLMPIMTLFLLAADLLLGQRGSRPSGQARLLGLLAYVPLLLGAMVLFWPYLWETPWLRLQEAFEIMSEYDWTGKVLLQGQFLPGTDIPWYYMPLWIGISTPPLYLLLAALGTASLLWKAWRNLRTVRPYLWATGGDRKDWAMLGLFLAPLLAIIVLESVVYDGWRHLYFVYPSLLYLAVLGLQSTWQWAGGWPALKAKYLQRAVVFALSVQSLFLVFWMGKHHPHQNVYFNLFAAGNQLGYYDLDYWGIAHKQAFEALATLDDRPLIRVAYQSYPAELNYEYLPSHLQHRFVLAKDPKQADYFLSDFRLWKTGMKRALQKEGLYAGEEVHAIYAGSSKVLGIYRLSATH